MEFVFETIGNRALTRSSQFEIPPEGGTTNLFQQPARTFESGDRVKIGITGHQYLDDPQGWDWVKGQMDDLLTRLPGPTTGISCLAVGADSLFAELVLHHRGSLEAVLPFQEYEEELQVADRNKYRELLAEASAITVIEKMQSKQQSYLEAGKRVVDIAELLLAVWNRAPARGPGGTADIVEYALQKRRDVVCLDPIRRLVTISGTVPWLGKSQSN